MPLAGFSQQLGRDYVIRVTEMEENLAVFEVFLPESHAGRKNVPHKVVDDAGNAIVTENFSTGDGHYKIAMVASYVHGKRYEFVVDGGFRLSFEYQFARKSPSE